MLFYMLKVLDLEMQNTATRSIWLRYRERRNILQLRIQPWIFIHGLSSFTIQYHFTTLFPTEIYH